MSKRRAHEENITVIPRHHMCLVGLGERRRRTIVGSDSPLRIAWLAGDGFGCNQHVFYWLLLAERHQRSGLYALLLFAEAHAAGPATAQPLAARQRLC